MHALRFHGPGDLRLEQVPEPEPSTGEVVVRVEACGVCGSDLHFLDGTAHTSHTPITLGHEIAGVVHRSDMSDWPVGTAILVAAGGHCRQCRRCVEGRVNLCERSVVMGIDVDGGLADFAAVRADMLIRRPQGLPAEVAATAVDAGATAFHAVTRRARVRPGDAVLVIGAGGLGGYAIQIARNAGASPVIAADIDPDRLAAARHLGADEAVLVTPETSLGRHVKLLTDGGVDTALEFVGRASTVDAAVKCLRPGGIAVAVGVGLEPLITIPPVLWSNNEYTLTGSYGSLPGDAEAVLAGLSDGTLEPPPIEEIPLAGAADVIGAAARGERPIVGRLMVRP
jgi:D-arabinose 1-dehydrogenase-like Zn-dependent alcohol dehydrogenase